MTDTQATDSPAEARGPVRLVDLIIPLLTTVAWLAILFAVSLAAMLMHGRFASDVTAFVAGLSRNFDAAQLFMASIYGAMLIGVWLVARRRGPATVPGYFARLPWSTILLAFLSGLLLAGTVIVAISWLGQSGLVTFHMTHKEELLLEARSPWQLALSLFVIAVVAPVVEELYFRGLLLSWLQRGLLMPVAAFVDATVFALVHARFIDHPGPEGWVLTVVVGLVGLLNVGWFVRTRSLWPSVATHAAYNGTLVIITYFAI